MSREKLNIDCILLYIIIVPGPVIPGLAFFICC
jgi:hypothetical protein